MKSFLLCFVFLFSSMSSAADHPWKDLVGKYHTVSINGVPVSQENYEMEGVVRESPSVAYLDLNGNRIPALRFYLFNSVVPGWSVYTWIDALAFGEYAVVGNSRVYQYSGKLRKNIQAEKFVMVDDKITITELETGVYEIHDQRHVDEGDHQWSTNDIIVIKRFR